MTEKQHQGKRGGSHSFVKVLTVGRNTYRLIMPDRTSPNRVYIRPEIP